MDESTALEADYRALAERCWLAVADRVDRRTGRRVPVPPYRPVASERSDARFGSDFPVLAHLDAALELALGAGLDDVVTRLAALARMGGATTAPSDWRTREITTSIAPIAWPTRGWAI